jgi:hypothetical protein
VSAPVSQAPSGAQVAQSHQHDGFESPFGRSKTGFIKPSGFSSLLRIRSQIAATMAPWVLDCLMKDEAESPSVAIADNARLLAAFDIRYDTP